MLARLSLVWGWRFARRRGVRRAARWGLVAWWSPLLRWGLLCGWRLLARPRRNAHVVRHDARCVTSVARRGDRRVATAGLVAAFLALSAAASASAQTASPAWELTSVHGPTNVPLTPSVNEVYKLTVRGSSGKYSLTFENEETGEFGTTKLIPFDASAQEVQEALEKLKEGEHKAIGEGNVKVTGGPGDEHGTKPYSIEFVGALGGRDLGTEALAIEETTLSEAEEERCEAEGAECEPEVTLATPGSRDIVDYQVIPRNTGGAAAKPPAPGQPITIRDNLPGGTDHASHGRRQRLVVRGRGIESGRKTPQRSQTAGRSRSRPDPVHLRSDRQSGLPGRTDRAFRRSSTRASSKKARRSKTLPTSAAAALRRSKPSIPRWSALRPLRSASTTSRPRRSTPAAKPTRRPGGTRTPPPRASSSTPCRRSTRENRRRCRIHPATSRTSMSSCPRGSSAIRRPPSAARRPNSPPASRAGPSRESAPARPNPRSARPPSTITTSAENRRKWRSTT